MEEINAICIILTHNGWFHEYPLSTGIEIYNMNHHCMATLKNHSWDPDLATSNILSLDVKEGQDLYG